MPRPWARSFIVSMDMGSRAVETVVLPSSRVPGWFNNKGLAMKLECRNNKDVWAGLILIGIGAAAMIISRNYRFGSALRMGPGFFPTILGGILIAFGICIMIVGLIAHRKCKR